MNIAERFLEIGEFLGAGLFEDEERSIFYRKAKGARRYWENCKLPEYTGKPLYPSGELDRSMKILPCFMAGVIMSDEFKELEPELAEKYEKDFSQYVSSVPRIHTVACDMALHSLPHYERVISEGFLSYIPRIERIEDKEIKDGLMEIIFGIEKYITRCITYLKNVNANPKIISALEQVPMKPARDIYEAVMCWNFVMYLDGCDNLGCLASGLEPYFKGENIVELLENLYDNLDINNGYSMALHGTEVELTLQCLEAAKGRRRPQVELLVDENTPRVIWEKAFECMRTSNGQPAFYSKQAYYNGLKKRLPMLTQDDLEHFCGVGCTESSIAGVSHVGSGDAGINVLWILVKYLHENLAKANDFEEFYKGFIQRVYDETDIVMREINNSQICRAKFCPIPMRTLLIDDCIDKGADFNNGGARYSWSLIYFQALSNVIDSLLVIRDFVFRDHKYTVEEFLRLLKENNEEFLKKCREYGVCHGIDHPEANDMAKCLTTDIYSYLDDKKPAMGLASIPAAIMFRSMAIHGKNVTASPDGRRDGDPLADSLGAVMGKDTKGPTALLKSVTSMNLERALGTPVLNMRIDPEISDENLKALIMGYIKLGGIQMQITCINPEILQEAYENPQMHKNLVVRVGGYSDYFYNLSDELKRTVIKRNVHR